MESSNRAALSPGAQASSARDPQREREKLRGVVAERGLCGLANDTKWDEFLTAMRTRSSAREWLPGYRYKCIDGPVSAWDCEYWYHLPFPLMSIEWLDLSPCVEVIREPRLPPIEHRIDHSPWIESLLARIGFEYVKGENMIRIFGYSPRSLERFDEAD